jgi:hypothetical protein
LNNSIFSTTLLSAKGWKKLGRLTATSSEGQMHAPYTPGVGARTTKILSHCLDAWYLILCLQITTAPEVTNMYSEWGILPAIIK